MILPACLLALVSMGQEEDSEVERGLVANTPGAFAGYTLFPPLRSTTTYLIDMEGEVVHTWESEHTPGNSTYLMDDGTLLRCCRMDNERFSGGGQGGRLQLHAWDGEVLWDYPLSDDSWMQHHDIEPLPNGNVLVIAWENVSKEDAIANGRDPEKIGDKGFWPDAIFEIEPILPDGGKVVWEWHSFDHLIQDFDETKAGHGDVTAHPERIDINGDHRDVPPMTPAERERQEELERQMRALGYTGEDDDEPAPEEPDEERGGRRRNRIPGDWLHSNSIAYHPELDLIVLSVRRFHEIWVLDHSTTTEEAAGSSGGRYGRGGDLLYRWGNPRTYGRGDESDRMLFGQHDATFVAGERPEELRVLVFNNGEGRPGGNFSSVDELLLPFDPERGFAEPEGAEPFAPTEPSWSYAAPEKKEFFSSFISGAQRLPNGNTLICSGVDGRFFEVTRKGEIVWDYLNPYGQARTENGREIRGGRGGPGPHGLFRGTRIAPDHPGLTGKALEAKAPTPAPVEDVALEGVAPIHVVGNLYLAGQPTIEAFEELREKGLEVVIDLRQEGELKEFDEPLLVGELGMRYVRKGFGPPGEMTNELLDELRVLLDEVSGETTLLHCAGSVRVGAVWLARRVLDEGIPFETALEEAREVGLRGGYEARAEEYIRQKER